MTVLGAAACAGAFVALGQLASTTAEQRAWQTRATVNAEIDRLVRLAPEGPAPRRRSDGVRLGLAKSGFLDANLDEMRPLVHLPPAASAARLEAAHMAVRSGERAIRETTTAGGMPVIVGVAPAPPVGLAWASANVPAEPSGWRAGVLLLALASLAMALGSLHTLFAFRGGVASLRRSLLALGHDLAAPTTRPRLRELAEVAQGIEAFAADLLRARDEHERLLRALADRERLASLGRVATGIAHEVRNPLAAIKLRVDLACMALDLPPALTRDLIGIAKEVSRLDALVTDLLAAGGRTVGERTTAELGALARSRADLVGPWAAERHVAIHVSGQATSSVDAGAMARVIDNLLRNAVEASPASSTVDVQVSQADRVRVEVCDTGAGVTPEATSRLFELFFTTKAGGTGLGLALSRAIAIAHGGGLSYDRNDGRTRFTLDLPG